MPSGHISWRNISCSAMTMKKAVLSNVRFAVIATLLLGWAPTAIARPHVAPHPPHEQIYRHSVPGHGSVGRFSGRSNSGDAWIYENNHYLQMLSH
jgi:hypothetical protein